jgi:diguanylate cyclase (GGDEF)-like protein
VAVRFRGPESVWLAGAGVLVCLGVSLSILLPRGYALTACGDLIQCLLLGFGLACFVGNAVSGEKRLRLFWGLLALGVAMWLGSYVLWTCFEVLLHKEAPNPFIGDIALFLHLVPMMGALAVQPEQDQDNDQRDWHGVLDFSLLFVWWLYLYLFLVIPWQYVWPDRVLYGHNFNVLYFAEHFVFLLGVEVVWRRSGGPWKKVYGQLFGAAAVYAIGSVAAGVAIDRGKYYTGSFYDLPLLVSMGWFVAIGLWARRLPLHAESAHGEPQGARGVWISRFAMLAGLSLPLLASWAVYDSGAPGKVKSFRLALTLSTMLVMGSLFVVKQLQLDRALARHHEELRKDSFTDPLTGARNRRFVATTIDGDVQQVLRSYSPAAGSQNRRNRDLIFYLIDADGFKAVNDRYGHDQGDRLLVEITRRISSAIRHSDVLIRWGGDEFLVVSRYTNREEAAALASRVLTAVGAEPFDLGQGQTTHIGCSLGWSVFPWFTGNPEAISYRDALRLADRALYEAKKAGKNLAFGMLPATETVPPKVAEVLYQSGYDILERLPVRTVLSTQDG